MAETQEEVDYMRRYATKHPGVVTELVKGKMVQEFEINENETELEALERRLKELKEAQKAADKEDKEFYVRVGNTTRPLDVQAAHDYISMHWQV